MKRSPGDPSFDPAPYLPTSNHTRSLPATAIPLDHNYSHNRENMLYSFEGDGDIYYIPGSETRQYNCLAFALGITNFWLELSGVSPSLSYEDEIHAIDDRFTKKQSFTPSKKSSDAKGYPNVTFDQNYTPAPALVDDYSSHQFNPGDIVMYSTHSDDDPYLWYYWSHFATYWGDGWWVEKMGDGPIIFHSNLDVRPYTTFIAQFYLIDNPPMYCSNPKNDTHHDPPPPPSGAAGGGRCCCVS